MSLADYAVTEAGFGADLGAEKFLDTKCRVAGIEPDCVVIVATVKALKLHGGADKATLSTENLTALEKGMPNLLKHIENIQNVYKKPVIVAMNRFYTDTLSMRVSKDTRNLMAKPIWWQRSTRDWRSWLKS